jgi:hypothetical protein
MRSLTLNFCGPSYIKSFTVTLYNLLGQEVGTVVNDFMYEGPLKFNVKERINKRLFTGQYIYQIQFSGKKYSKSILVK